MLPTRAAQLGDQDEKISGDCGRPVDPCLSPSGANICQQWETIAQRPTLAGCVWTPMSSVCQTTPPPVPFEPYEAMPPTASGRKPWLTQSVCNHIHFLCSEGQIPEEEPAPAGDYEALVVWTKACLDRAQGMLNMCKVLLDTPQDLLELVQSVHLPLVQKALRA